MSAVLVKFPRATFVNINTEWLPEHDIIVNFNVDEITDFTLNEGVLKINLELNEYQEGIYILDLFNDTLGEIAPSTTILLVNPQGMYRALKPLADYLEKAFITEERSIMNYTSADFLRFVYNSFLSWGYDEAKTALSDRFIIVDSSINILSAILDAVLNRDVLETPELKVDDSKLTERILKRIAMLEAEKSDLVVSLFPDIAAEATTQPVVNVEVSSVYRARHGIVVPQHLNQPPSAANLKVEETEAGYNLSWDISYTDDFVSYKIYSTKNGRKTLEKALFNNHYTRYTLEKTNIDSILLEIHDSGGLFSQEEYKVGE